MFRFTTRDVLLATVIVGLGLGWRLDRLQLSNRLRREENVELLNAMVKDSWGVLDARAPGWRELNQHCPSQTRFAARTRFDGHGPPQGDSLSPPARAAGGYRCPEAPDVTAQASSTCTSGSAGWRPGSTRP